VHTLLDTRESTLRPRCENISDVENRDFLGLCLKWVVHVMIHSTCIAVWFYVFFIHQPWEDFQGLRSCVAFDVTDIIPSFMKLLEEF